MEIQNEIAKTKKRIDLLEGQNEKFKVLLNKALKVTLESSINYANENQFLQESIEVIEEEKEKLKEDLGSLVLCERPNIDDITEKLRSLEDRVSTHERQIERLRAEHGEIKFLLLHPESRNAEWLKNVLQLDNETSDCSRTSLVEERFRLQRKILNLEKKKAELLIAINDVAVPEQVGNLIRKDLEIAVFQTIEKEDNLKEYEDLRFKMLNLEDERSRLLGDLQNVLNKSRKEIAEEYNRLQERILAVERQKASLNLNLKNSAQQDVTQKELESIFGAFRNLPLSEAEEKARMERVKAEIGSTFCPGLSLPMYCTIL